MGAELRCAAHEELGAIRRCQGCGRGMCPSCWTQDLDEKATCAACVAVLTRPLSPLVPLLGSVLAITVGWLAFRRTILDPDARAFVFGVFALLTAITAYRRTWRVNARRTARQVRLRSEALVDAPLGAPYRGLLDRGARRLAPPVSGALATLIVGGALALSAALVPTVVVLPPWLATEVVLGIWWGIWTCALTLLLHRGWHIADDGLAPKHPLPEQPHRPGLADGLSPDAGGDGIAMLLALIVVWCAGWLAVDLLFPLALIGIYLVLAAGLRRVAHDRHDCEGRPGRALRWGAAWAALYTLPLAVIVALLHVARR